MADTELKNCPFCGGAVELERTTGSYEKMHGQREWWGVVCRNTINVGGTCAIQQVPSASKEAAVERWNRRSTSSVNEGEMPELPPLPEADVFDRIPHGRRIGYTAGQMQEYARAAIADLSHKLWCAEVNLDGAKEHIAELLATKAAAPDDAPWHNAVLAECMKIETGYQPADPVATIKTVIDWHMQEASGVAEGVKIMADNYVRLTCGRAPAEDAREEVQDELLRDAMRHRYTRMTTTAVRDPESGDRIEVTPEMYDAAIDSAMQADPSFAKGIKAHHLVAARRASSVPAISGTGREKEWKLVPVEPTEEMRTACRVLNYADDIDAEWARLLAAAPSHPLEAKAGEDA